jgi:hypothetical protein
MRSFKCTYNVSISHKAAGVRGLILQSDSEKATPPTHAHTHARTYMVISASYFETVWWSHLQGSKWTSQKNQNITTESGQNHNTLGIVVISTLRMEVSLD